MGGTASLADKWPVLIRQLTSRRGDGGGPRSFDAEHVLDNAIELFWANGFNAVTTRSLEAEIGISQSSIYNAFGSKDGLIELIMTRYLDRHERIVLSTLAKPDADADHRGLLDFIEAMVQWVGDDEHPGCLLLNYSNASDRGRELAVQYRERVRQLVTPIIARETDDEDLTRHRTELLVAAVLGLSTVAGSGADQAELRRLADGITSQITDWFPQTGSSPPHPRIS